MRVVCHTVEEFLENLRDEPSVFRDVVRCSRVFRPVDTESLREALKVEVVFQASAVVDLGDDGQYLLEVGVNCGFDYKDGPEPELKGSGNAAAMRKKIIDYCESRGLKVRPGVIDM
jgi:hypothetical protein